MVAPTMSDHNMVAAAAATVVEVGHEDEVPAPLRLAGPGPLRVVRLVAAPRRVVLQVRPARLLLLLLLV